MDKLTIEGGASLFGEISASGSKNAALPIIFATILSSEKIIVKNTPHLKDVATTLKILHFMGGDCILDGNNDLIIDNSNINNYAAEYELVKTMRASILTLGPLLAKYGAAKISLPGGCAIGARPVDLHIKALKELGANIEVKNGYIYATADKLVGTDIFFDKTSVTATENILMAATLAQGTTTIHNAAQEPEITDLICFLRKMGANIKGDGTTILTIKGVDRLHSAEYSVCYDRIEIGTYLVAAAITSGKITIKNIDYHSISSVVEKLKQANCKITNTSNSITLDATHTDLQSVNIKTDVFPGFPTDMQAQFSVLNAVAKGSNTITETIFENRFMHIPELNRMGADFTIDGNSVHSCGNKKLTGATLMATDLRASASLVLAGLCATGTTTIERIYHLDRGYEMIEEKLKLLGATIKRTHN